MRPAYQKKQEFEEWVLPREFSLEVAELTGALREGLTAVGLKAAMVIAQQNPAARRPQKHRRLLAPGAM